MKILLMLLKWAKNVPVLFAHFPGPSLLLVGVAMLAAGAMSSCVTHRLEAGARAEIKMELAQCQVGHAQAVATAAQKREGIVVSAFEEQSAINRENAKVMLEQLRQLVATADDTAALARLNKLIEGMKNDPAYACRLLPLPDSYLDGVRFPAEEVRPATGGP